MNVKTKIIVLRMKQLIYFALSAISFILLLLLLIMSFSSGKKTNTASDTIDPSDTQDTQNSSYSSENPKETAHALQTADDITSVSVSSHNNPSDAVASDIVASDAVGSEVRLPQYIPGLYTTELVLNDQSVQIELIVDQSSVTSLRLANLSDEVRSLYPLLEPAFEHLRNQIYEKQTLDEISYNTEQKYTSLVLLEAIRNSLEKAQPESSAD